MMNLIAFPAKQNGQSVDCRTDSSSIATAPKILLNNANYDNLIQDNYL